MRKSTSCLLAILLGAMFGAGVMLAGESTTAETVGMALIFGAVGGILTLVFHY